MKQSTRKLFSALLSLVMLLSIFGAAFADETQPVFEGSVSVSMWHDGAIYVGDSITLHAEVKGNGVPYTVRWEKLTEKVLDDGTVQKEWKSLGQGDNYTLTASKDAAGMVVRAVAVAGAVEVASSSFTIPAVADKPAEGPTAEELAAEEEAARKAAEEEAARKAAEEEAARKAAEEEAARKAAEEEAARKAAEEEAARKAAEEEAARKAAEEEAARKGAA